MDIIIKDLIVYVFNISLPFVESLGGNVKAHLI